MTSWMYCMTTKKNPKLAKNSNVTPTDPVAKSGSAEQPNVQQRMAPAQLDETRMPPPAPPRRHRPADQRVAPSARRRLDHAEHEDRHSAADEHRARPVQRGGIIVARRRHRAGEHEQHGTRAGEGPEDRVPRPEVQQDAGAEEADDGAGSRDAGPDADRLGRARPSGRRRSRATAWPA